MTESGLYEKLAAIEHERWSDWQRYVHSLCTRQDDGSLVIPAELVAQWERQIKTDYADLSEAEKDSDREQVDRYWPLVSSADGGAMTAPTAERTTVSGNDQAEHTGGMVALIPTTKDAAKLAVDGGDPAEQLHLTLAYLGDDVTDWDDEIVAAVHEVARKLTDPAAVEDDDDQPVPADGHDYRGPGQRDPLTLTVFSHSHFNPNGGPDDQEPCMVYQFSGDGDLNTVESLHSEVYHGVKDAIGEVNFPEQHARFTPHVTAGYNLPPDALSYTGPVTFDRLRVALADEVTDYPLGGGTMDEVTAAVARTKSGSVSAEAREKAKKDGDTYPGTDKFPISTRELAKSAVRLAGTSDIPAEKVRKWLMGKLKAKGWQDLIPDTWKSDGTITASATLDDGQCEALTAAVGALVEKLGPVAAHGIAPQVFPDARALEFADTLIELPPADGEHLTASAGVKLPPISVFDKPENLPPGTGHHVDYEPLPCGLRRVYGRLGEWNVPHIGINGQKVYIPRSPSGYRWFHTKSAWAQGENGPEEIEVGHLTFGTGHAPTGPGVDYMAAAAHYDHSGNRGATIRVYDDDPIGPVYAGVTVAGLEGARLQEFTESDISGDWRRPMGLPLDLIATLCVNVGGFPKIGLSLAASGEPLALVASARAWGNPSALVDVDAIAAAVVTEMGRRSELAGKRDALLAATDDAEDRMAELLVSLYWDEFDFDNMTDDELTADAMPVSRMPIQLQESYVAGKVAQRIRWGVPGDFKRCVAQAKIHGMGRKAEGACAMLHHKALGAWPGREHGKGKALAASATTGEENELGSLDSDRFTW